MGYDCNMLCAKSIMLFAASLTVAALNPSGAFAQGNANKPTKPGQPVSVTLTAKDSVIVFGQTTALSGKITDNRAAGAVVRFEQDVTAPYGDSYTPSPLVATASKSGQYSISVAPSVNTLYRATAQVAPPVKSPAVLVRVRTRVSMNLSDSTPRRGSLLRFTGSVSPAHDGARALLQKRSPTGRWVTLARPLLTDAGTTRSAYSSRLRVYRDGDYRVKFAAHADHLNGFSVVKTIDVS